MNIYEILNDMTPEQKEATESEFKKYEYIYNGIDGHTKKLLFISGWFSGREAMYEESLQPGEGKS